MTISPVDVQPDNDIIHRHIVLCCNPARVLDLPRLWPMVDPTIGLLI